MTRALVTGGSGFTGRYLTDLLAARGHQVHALAHAKPSSPVAGADKVHIADLTDLSSVTAIVDQVRPDVVVHLAAIAFVAHGDVGEMYRTNVVGTRQLLEALSRSDGNLRSVVLASSANVYGNARAGILDETMPPAPANDYGVSKVAMEYVAQLYRDKLPLTLVRPFNYTGVGQSAQFLIPKIVAHARARADVIELGNLEVARDFLDVRTVADAYLRLLESPQAIGSTFNICSGQATSLQSLLDLVMQLAGHRIEVRVNPAFVRADEVRSLCGSAARLEQAIGPLKQIPLEETLRWMLES